MTFHLEIITPERIIYEDDANEIVAQTRTGEIAVLPNHVSLLTQLVPGEFIIKKGNSTQFIAVAGGFLQVHKNSVTLLADYAVPSEEINTQKALEAQKRAEQLMRDAKEKSNDRDFATAQTAFYRALLELKVAQKRKHRQTPVS